MDQTIQFVTAPAGVKLAMLSAHNTLYRYDQRLAFASRMPRASSDSPC